MGIPDEFQMQDALKESFRPDARVFLEKAILTDEFPRLIKD
jgi:hypothetical protein